MFEDRLTGDETERGGVGGYVFGGDMPFKCEKFYVNGESRTGRGWLIFEQA